jgi:hypothetical protein
MRIRLPDCATETRTRPPSGEYLTALSTRFVRTWRNLSGSAATGGSAAGASTDSVTVAGAWARTASTTPVAREAALQLSIAIDICPESSRLAQRMSLTMRASLSASLEMTSSSPERCDSSSRMSPRWRVSAAP